MTFVDPVNEADMATPAGFAPDAEETASTGQPAPSPESRGWLPATIFRELAFPLVGLAFALVYGDSIRHFTGTSLAYPLLLVAAVGGVSCLDL
ncbi:MAG TPA: hypothetical protein VGC05_04965, partial [Mycobacterium sp.]